MLKFSDPIQAGDCCCRRSH